MADSYKVDYEEVISFGKDASVEELSEQLLLRSEKNQQQIFILSYNNAVSMCASIEIYK